MPTHVHAATKADNQQIHNAPRSAQLSAEQGTSFDDHSLRTAQLASLQSMMSNSPQQQRMQSLQAKMNGSAQAQQMRTLQSRMVAGRVIGDVAQREEVEEPLQAQSLGEAVQRRGVPSASEAPKPNNTGLPDQLKSGVESLSGMSMDHVKVHYNSDKPAQLQAHAYAQGSEIHVAPGQERHLPHEAWHVVQQAQGRVKPTLQMNGGANVNDDVGLESEADLMGERALGTVQMRNERSGGMLAATTPQRKSSYVNGSTIQLAVGDVLPTIDEHMNARIPKLAEKSIFNKARGNFAIQTPLPDSEKVKFAQALKAMPTVKLLLYREDPLDGIFGPKANSPKPRSQSSEWKDGGLLTQKIIVKPKNPSAKTNVRTDIDDGKLLKKIAEGDGKVKTMTEPEVLSIIDRPAINVYQEHGIEVSPQNGFRAFHDSAGVHIGQDVPTSIVVHEVGHHIEDNLKPEVFHDIVLLRDARHKDAGGGVSIPAQPMSNEEAYKGAYPATGQYTSKNYGAGAPTEVLSMTAEKLSDTQSALAMINSDPLQTAIILRGLSPKEYAATAELRAFDIYLPRAPGDAPNVAKSSVPLDLFAGLTITPSNNTGERDLIDLFGTNPASVKPTPSAFPFIDNLTPIAGKTNAVPDLSDLFGANLAPMKPTPSAFPFIDNSAPVAGKTNAVPDLFDLFGTNPATLKPTTSTFPSINHSMPVAGKTNAAPDPFAHLLDSFKKEM
jgi:Domain of unknown function (DUF4157)